MKFIKKISLLIVFVITLFIAFQTATESNSFIKANAADISDLYQKEIEIKSDGDTGQYWAYYSSVPNVVSFMDYKNNYNVVSHSDSVLYVYRYDENLKFIDSLIIKYPLSTFGNIICDDSGNYYICWGAYDVDSKNTTVIAVTKYDYSGKKIGEVSFKGYEISPYTPNDYWGTKYPFDAGSCAMAINNGILACNFAREMYSGHQSNAGFYIDCKTMTEVSGTIPYCSHSFAQDCIATSDGGFLMANHGDAYNRGFLVSKIQPTDRYCRNIYTFHFREGTNRSFGYNETYAQLGGVTETKNAYVLCAASERTLSLDVAPTKGNYLSYSEARDLFVQILRKDFYNYDNKDAFFAKGETRKATGSAPASAETELWLSSGVKDYGVIWLTDYDDNYFAYNPKVVTIDNNRILVLWEKRPYDYYANDSADCTAYYMILNEDGSIYKAATKINAELPTDADVVYHNGSVYWTTYNNNVAKINVLNVSEHRYSYTVKNAAKCTSDGTASYVCLDCKEKWQPASDIAVPRTGHNYKNVKTKATTSKNGSVDTKCNNCGDIKASSVIYYPQTIKLSATAFTYNGKAKAPSVTVKDSKGKALINGTDYTVTYPSAKTNAGKYAVKITLKGNYSGTKTLYYTINPDSSAKTVTLSATQYTYSGTAKAPSVAVKDSRGKTLVKGTDYTVAYSDGRINPGKYAVKVIFKGNYSGTVTKYYLILPGKTSKVTATTTATTLKPTWNKVTGATGYKVEVINSSSKVVKTVHTRNNYYTFSGLTTATYYKVRVTAYKTIKDKNEYSLSSVTISTYTKPSTPTFTVSSTTKGKANFSWSDVNRETGYQVYCATSKNGTYSKVGTYAADSKSGSKSSLTSGKTYYFKVRAYKKTGDTVIYSGWSTVKNVRVK